VLSVGAQSPDGKHPETHGFISDYFDRKQSPAETVEKMRGRLLEFGITRLARVTGLDCVGIPVWSAIRPNSRTLSVSQGKGIDDAAAAASAVMEAVEVATAERTDLRRITRSPQAMSREERAHGLFQELLRSDATLPAPTDPIDWIEGYDLVAEAPVWVPTDVVTLFDGRKRSRYWQSTDGLASGNVLWEATFHGLCERVERDALALWALRDDAWVTASCRDARSFSDSEIRKLVTKIDEAGLQLRLFDITSDVGIPVYFATISPAPTGHEANWKYFDLSSGSGCHPSRVRAVIRAVTEAAQTRVTTISAARDDFDPVKYRKTLSPDLLHYVRVSPPGVAPDEIFPSIERTDYIAAMIERLKRVGVRSAVVVPLEAGESGYAVAKVLVPDLETISGERRFAHGKRSLRAKMGLT
jgi:YcaO-like protein with predicted kinase domain